MSADRLGFAVIAQRRPHSNQDFDFNPSDGPSYAVITRVSVASPAGKNEESVGRNLRTYAWRVDAINQLSGQFTLAAGQMRRTSVTLRLPQGSYQFVVGYGQDVLSGRCVTSNAVTFDVDQTGNAIAR